MSTPPKTNIRPVSMSYASRLATLRVKPFPASRWEIGSRIERSVQRGKASPNAPKAATIQPVKAAPKDDARARNQMRARIASPPTSSPAPAKLTDESL